MGIRHTKNVRDSADVVLSEPGSGSEYHPGVASNASTDKNKNQQVCEKMNAELSAGLLLLNNIAEENGLLSDDYRSF
ncbi:hypothetical protein [Citrobacter werkmanii]|uniref:hypothetical protein n=1 Tax=Citrobacter werkmanii TaxID=67827 RepID=UPI00264C69A8|nr:hypothetical protein [Citrobacter werkmanii]MDN8558371.1 hypothetical protein [Citrobacter werkmanii]